MRGVLTLRVGAQEGTDEEDARAGGTDEARQQRADEQEPDVRRRRRFQVSRGIHTTGGDEERSERLSGGFRYTMITTRSTR